MVKYVFHYLFFSLDVQPKIQICSSLLLSGVKSLQKCPCDYDSWKDNISWKRIAFIILIFWMINENHCTISRDQNARPQVFRNYSAASEIVWPHCKFWHTDLHNKDSWVNEILLMKFFSTTLIIKSCRLKF